MTDDNRVEARLNEIEKNTQKNSIRIETLLSEFAEIKKENKTIYKLTTNIELIAKEISIMREDLVDVKNGQSTLTQKVLDIENKPAQLLLERNEKIKTAIITSTVTFLITGILGAIIIFIK